MLDTLANVKQLAGITTTDYDAVLTQIMEGVDEAINQYLGYDIESHTVTDEYHIADGVTKVFTLESAPVTSLVVKYDGDTQDTDAYELYPDTGIVVFGSPVSKSTRKLSFSYTGGYSTVPADLRLAFDRMVLSVFYNRKSSDVESEKMGDYSVVYGSIQKEMLNYKDVLDNYVRLSA